MKYDIVATILFLLIAVTVTPHVFASNEIKFTTDKSIYEIRDTIQIEGFVNYLKDFETNIQLEILNTDDKVVYRTIAEFDKSNLDFDSEISLFGTVWNQEGEYKVFVTYGNSTKEKRIHIFQSSDNVPKYFDSKISFDKTSYSMTDTVEIFIDSPSFNLDSDEVEYIGIGTKRGNIEIKTSMGVLSSYRLVETEKNSGIFHGKIVLTGDPNLDLIKGTFSDQFGGEIRGTGPFDGKIAVFPNDNVMVTFTNQNESVTEFTEVSWSTGQVELYYDKKDNLVIRVADPDMNFKYKVKDSVEVVLRDDYNFHVTKKLIETGLQTGIFERIIEHPHPCFSITYEDFTTDDDSSVYILIFHNSFGETGTQSPENYGYLSIPKWIKQIISWNESGLVSDEEIISTLYYLVEKNVISKDKMDFLFSKIFAIYPDPISC